METAADNAVAQIVENEETQEDDLNEINFREILQYAGDLQDYIGMDQVSAFPMRTRDINVHRYKYTLPKDFMYFISEEAELERLINGRKVYRNAIVTPIDYNQLTMLRGSTYKFPVQNECWRVLNKREITTDAEILTPYASEIVNYAMRYVRKPKPIILINIGNVYGTTIDGEWGEGLPDDVSDAQVCELPEAMHDEIVQRAVEIAKATYRTGETEALFTYLQYPNVYHTLCAVIDTAVMLLVLFNACKPFNWYRKIVFGLTTVLTVVGIVVARDLMQLTFVGGEGYFGFGKTEWLLLIIILLLAYPVMWCVKSFLRLIRVLPKEVK